MNMIEVVYLNGKFLPVNEACVSVNDSGFLYGYGCYETLRGYQGRIFRLDDHLRRLSQTAEKLQIVVDIQQLKKVIPEILSQNGYADSRVRITISAGEEVSYTGSESSQKATTLVTAVKYTPFPAELYEKGYKLIVTQSHRNSLSILSGLKTTCLLENMLVRSQANLAGADDAVFLNEKGMLAEASSSNVFIYHEGVLKTPRLGSGLLAGVTRHAVLELAKTCGLAAKEVDITPEELKTSGEVFLTNSMMEIMPVTRIEEKAVGFGKPGPVTHNLIAAYKELVSREAC
jgi:branched-chain amino acid aminotransferase